MSLQTDFINACEDGDKDTLVSLLTNYPNLDVNQADKYGQTPFYLACAKGHTALVACLMKDPRVDVQKTTNDETTPFYIACCNGHTETVELLLQDPRVDVNQADSNKQTPFYAACLNGYKKTVELLQKNPRIDVNQQGESNLSPFYIACASRHANTTIALLQDPCVDISLKSSILLKSRNKQKTGLDLWVEQLDTNLSEDAIAVLTAAIVCYRWVLPKEISHKALRAVQDEVLPPHLFALSVFFTDEYLALKPGAEEKAARFFEIIRRLPIELQMSLCYRVYGDTKTNIPSNDAEVALRYLVRTYPGPQPTDPQLTSQQGKEIATEIGSA